MIDAAYGEWLARGVAHQRAGSTIDAMLCFRQALSVNRHAVLAQFHLGETLSALRMPQQAVDAWSSALAMQPQHLPTLLALAGELHRAGVHIEAIARYRKALEVEPANILAREGLALSTLALGDDHAFADLATLLASGASDMLSRDAVAGTIAAAPPSAPRSALLEQVATLPDSELPALMLALAAADAARLGKQDSVRSLLERARARTPIIEEPEPLRLLALAADRLPSSGQWAAEYALRAVQAFAPSIPAMWPRRAAGDALRVAWMIAPGSALTFDDLEVDVEAYLEHVVAALASDPFASVAFIVDATPANAPSLRALQGLRVVTLGHAPAASIARVLGEGDYDVMIDLAGMASASGVLLAARPARTVMTLSQLHGAHVAPLVDTRLAAPEGSDPAALARHRAEIAKSLASAVQTQGWFNARSSLSPEASSSAWRAAVAAHQAGERDAALAGYRGVLAEQPGFAPAEHFSGVLLRDGGFADAAMPHFAAAVAATPAYPEARVALANLVRERGDPGEAARLCREGLARIGSDAALWRSLGLAELALHDAPAARAAFERALALAPTDGETHYNHGVALQTLRAHEEALRAYQRALAFAPDLLAADFNIGVVLQEQGRGDAAIHVFEKVLAREPRHVLAYKALGDTLLAARRIDDWLKVFDRFEAACPHAVSLVAWALEACQYRGDFAALDRYLDRLRQDDFKAENETDLADSLEQILFLMLYFDLEPEAQFGLYRAYDAVARRVYGTPLPRRTERRPGKLRIGYLSGDLRNHVMGKMIWEAVRHHDRQRFEIFCYTAGGASDEFTEQFRQFADRFEVVADLSERAAAQRIAGDDIDILVDLSTHTKNAKPGILALKPARVQITHIASAGALGLCAVDFKLTDACCDPPENQAFLLETLLPMQGCVYPYRHVDPAPEHPFHRAPLGIKPEAIVIGAFVNPLKLSRRCLSLWREVLERIPGSILAISPLSREASGVYARLLSAASIPIARVIVLPQGRNDAEGQARYSLLDFCLDPLPYGGVNSTLEALDMRVPVVTLRGRKHGERTSTSILVNLGVTHTIADSGSEYVAIAHRLATDSEFRSEVVLAIATGLQSSSLVDMERHARALEAAYVDALRRAHPEVLAQDGA
ncbi:MAG: tetratricopeptide repeat protein [Betaproteobacteria bacterium]